MAGRVRQSALNFGKMQLQCLPVTKFLGSCNLGSALNCLTDMSVVNKGLICETGVRFIDYFKIV